MSKAKNDRWTETYARGVLEGADRRKLSDSALARELGVSPQRIYWWRKRLQDTQSARKPAFAEVRLATVRSQPLAASAVKLTAARPQPFTIRIHSGRTIEVPPGFDAAELARLIAALETSC